MKKNRLSLIMVIMVIICIISGCTDKNEINVNIDKGMELIKQNEYDAALSCFEAAIVYKEDSQLLYRGEGIAYMGLKEYEKAVESFMKSFEFSTGVISKLEFDTNYYLASSYYKLGNYKEAYDVYSAIIDYDPNEKDAYFLRACALLKEGNLEAAQVDFEKNLKMQSYAVKVVIQAFDAIRDCGYEKEAKEYISRYLELKAKELTDDEKGTLYYYLEDYDNARIYLDSALTRGNADVSLLLGKTYEHLGDMNYASVVYKTYLESNNPKPEIYNSLGTCLLQQKKYEEALKHFEAGIEMGESLCLCELRFNQIVSLEYLGKFSKAKELMQLYIVDYPEDEIAKREYEFLQTR